MRRMLWCGPLLAGALALTGCAPTPATPAADETTAAAPAADAPADIAALNAAREAFMAAYKAGDASAIGRLYAEDAVSMSNQQQTLEGRDAIVDSLSAAFAEVTVEPALTPDETRTLGNVGFDRGHYIATVTPKSGATPTTSEGRYLVIFVKGDDGQWRVWRDMDNAAGVPPPTAEAAADGAGGQP